HVRGGRAGLAAGIAACLTVPAISILPALLRTWRRPGALAVLVFVTGAVVTIEVAGTGVIRSFLETAGQTAGTYAYAVTNYAVLGRAAGAGANFTAVIGTTAFLAVVSWIRGEEPDDAFAAFAVLGLLVSPLVWSQQLALILVPAAVLFSRLVGGASSLPLALWATLMLLLSLPDGSAAWFSQLLPIRFPGGVLPVVSVGLVVLWGWVVGGGSGGAALKWNPST
nr:hypothetical protein [Acidobacteriota bacterium]